MNGYIHITAPDPLAPKTSPFFLEVTWPTRGSGMVGFDPDGVVSIEEGPVAIRFESTGRALLWLFHVAQIIRDEESKREALADEENEDLRAELDGLRHIRNTRTDALLTRAGLGPRSDG